MSRQPALPFGWQVIADLLDNALRFTLRAATAIALRL
jgi:hypothetical protein